MFFILLPTGKFTFPVQNTVKMVNKTGDMTFEWRYELDNVKHVVQCGYRRLFLHIIIRQENDGRVYGRAVVQPRYLLKVQVIKTRRRIIKFKMKNCQLADTGPLGCEVQFSKKLQRSAVYIFEVYGEFVHFLIFNFIPSQNNALTPSCPRAATNTHKIWRGTKDNGNFIWGRIWQI